MKISCIDIGGTYIKSGVLEDGVLTGVEETPTDGGGGARAMLSRVAQLVRQTPGVERVGVSTAGEVDARTGVIRLSDKAIQVIYGPRVGEVASEVHEVLGDE